MNNPKPLPPPRFRPVGAIAEVRYSPTPPPFVTKKRKYGRKAEGVRYEAKLHKHLEDLYEGQYVASPWFIFREVGSDKERWCQPDGLLFQLHLGRIIIVECKLQHTSDAWWQLKWLYLPVIARAFPETIWSHAVCEVTKWYDPACWFPEQVKLRKHVADAAPGEFGVHIWKPRLVI